MAVDADAKRLLGDEEVAAAHPYSGDELHLEMSSEPR